MHASLEQLKTNKSISDDLLKSSCAQITLLQENVKLLQRKVMSLALDQGSFRNDDEKVRYYTGLTNWTILLELFQYIEGSIISQGHSVISPFQQLILTLMRLRLSLSGQDLSYRFSIHSSTVSRIFTSILYILYERLKHLIVWPERETLKKTLPMDFRKHCPTCTVIIDCFEIFVDRPSDLLARAQTYSHLKAIIQLNILLGSHPKEVLASFQMDGEGDAVINLLLKIQEF